MTPNGDPISSFSRSDVTSDAHAATLARLDALETKLAQESKARAVEMATQEHRLVPAVASWLRAAFARPFDSERFTACSQALVWCLIPSPATATISLVSVLGLVVALQANRLLMLQTERMEEQNMLAEAQRRASLVIEATSVFEQIEREKEKIGSQGAGNICAPDRAAHCWNGPLFLPTEATMGRLAALTQALRPYRYLVVESHDVEQPCDKKGDAKPASISKALFERSLALEGSLDREAASLVIQLQLQRNAATLAERVENASRWLTKPTATSDSEARLSCQALSPERGQLLASLYAARIDLSALALRGATFELADLPDQSNLDGIVLKAVNLSGARLRGARFTNAVLDSVNFEGADLSRANLESACMEENKFGGAELETLGKLTYERMQKKGSVPLFFLPRHLSTGDKLDRVWVRYKSADDGFERFCSTLNALEVTGRTAIGAHLRKHWVVEVKGSNSISGAALLSPNVLSLAIALSPDLASPRVPSLSVERNGTSVHIFALSTCPVLEAHKPDAQMDELMARELEDCKRKLAND